MSRSTSPSTRHMGDHLTNGLGRFPSDNRVSFRTIKYHAYSSIDSNPSTQQKRSHEVFAEAEREHLYTQGFEQVDYKRRRLYVDNRTSVRHQTDTIEPSLLEGTRKNDNSSARYDHRLIDAIPGNMEQSFEEHKIPDAFPTMKLDSALIGVHATDPRVERATVIPSPAYLPPPDLDPPMNEAIYVRLEKVTVTNKDFRAIKLMNSDDSWWCDNNLDAALEILARDYECAAHHIAIANSLVSSLLWRIGHFGDVDEDNFSHYKEEKKFFQDKKWIFLPINDGFAFEDPSAVRGAHWSLIATDRIHKKAHYIDSLQVHHRDRQEEAFKVAVGLASLLEEDYEFHVEFHSPKQFTNNDTSEDIGPCGPFVAAYAKALVEEIRRRQNDGDEEEVCLHISSAVGLYWRFSSGDIRHELQLRLAEEKRAQRI